MKTVLFLIMLTTTAASAETYQWTDKADTVHFSESLGAVPAEYRKNALPLGMDPEAARTGNKSASAAELGPGGEQGGIAPQIDDLKERMMNDQGIMSLITALQSDPAMQALVNDPAIMRAIQSGDIGTLINNPAFMKLLDDPRVREIEKSIQQGGTR